MRARAREYGYALTHNRRKITTFYGNMQIFCTKNIFFLRKRPILTEINLLIAEQSEESVFERSEELVVEEFALFVTEPAPFIEVATHIDNMYPQIAQGVVRCLPVMMHNRNGR